MPKKVPSRVIGYNGRIKILNCLCPDGKRRVAQTTADPDTWFSTPARVQVKGLSVSGFITSHDDGDIKFLPYVYRKNYKAFNFPV